MRIVFVIGGLGLGGQERALSTLANSLADRGYRVKIVCLFLTPVAFPLRECIEVVWPEIDRRKMGKILYALRIVRYLRRAIADSDAEVVVSFGDWYNSFTIVSLLGLSRKVVVSSRMGPELKLGLLLDAANVVLYRFAHKVIVQTERAREIFAKRYSCKRIFVVPNAVEMYSGPRESERDKVVVSVGRLSREKGHAVLIKAFSKLDAPSWRLVLIGDGPAREGLESLGNKVGIGERVQFLGSRKDIWDVLAKAEIFVLPSFYEGFPNALIEAMSVPLCCVASDCVAGPSEIIKHGESGFLFQPGSDIELAKILRRIVNDDALRASVAERGLTVRERYAPERVAREWMEALSA
jgi:GalNAc-alpha-(1->4)-GalNAc-alpha-(1->3)-diNAcBac-PP-undecaprenol alpha-1,4-N-acetyl-D-galactosaminyltransferase